MGVVFVFFQYTTTPASGVASPEILGGKNFGGTNCLILGE